jgi:hypothetical protein
MAKFITYKSDIISGSIMQVPSIVADLTGTASYGLYFVTAAFASNASGSWLSSSFNLPSSSTETIIGFDPVGIAAIYAPPTGAYLGVNYGGNAWPYLTIKNGSAGWSIPVVKNATLVPMMDNEVYFSAIALPRVIDFNSNTTQDYPNAIELNIGSLFSITSSMAPTFNDITYNYIEYPDAIELIISLFSITSSMTPIFTNIGYTTGST